MAPEVRNAMIGGTFLGVEDHGIMTFWLQLDYGSSSQGAGGYMLDAPWHAGKPGSKRLGTAVGMSLVMRVLEVVGVDSWEKLKGERIRVVADGSKIHGIGHYLKDEWVDFSVFFEEFKRKYEE